MQKQEKLLISAEQINSRIKKLGEQITKDFEGKDLLILSVLKGSFIFMADLVREVKQPVTLDFVGVSSYDGTQSTNEFKVTKEINVDIKGKDILLVEDIIDTGNTIKFLTPYLKERGAKSIKLCTFLSKPKSHHFEMNIDYIGFEIGDEFVIGYGLDYNEQYRNLPDVRFFEQ